MVLQTKGTVSSSPIKHDDLLKTEAMTPTTMQKLPKPKARKRVIQQSIIPNRTTLAPLQLLSPTLPLPPPNKDQALHFPLGRNIPSKIPLLDSVQKAQELGYSALQIFLTDPDTWQSPMLSPTLTLSMSQILSDAHLSPIVVHAPFVIDLASNDERTWINSVFLLRSTLEQARLIGASDVVVHLNNYKKAFVRVSGIQAERIVKAITYSLLHGPGTHLAPIRLLLENGCDPRFSFGSKIEELGTILTALQPTFRSHVRVCLDTAHCWVAGYDLCTQMDKFLFTVDKHIGLEHVQLLHLNDAKHGLGSIRDEHAQWSMGRMSKRGIAGIQMLLQDPRLAHIALIMETPMPKDKEGKPDWEQEKQNLVVMKRLLLSPD